MQGKAEELRRVLSLLNHSRAGWAGWEAREASHVVVER